MKAAASVGDWGARPDADVIAAPLDPCFRRVLPGGPSEGPIPATTAILILGLALPLALALALADALASLVDGAAAVVGTRLEPIGKDRSSSSFDGGDFSRPRSVPRAAKV